MDSDHLIGKLIAGITQPDPEKREEWMVKNSPPVIQIAQLWLKELDEGEAHEDHLHLIISCLLNITAAANHPHTTTEDRAALLGPIRDHPQFVSRCLEGIIKSDPLADMYIGVLINMTRDNNDLAALLRNMKSDDLFRKLIAQLNVTPPILGILINMTQNEDARRILVRHHLIENAFKLYDDTNTSKEERFKVLQLIRNLSFDESLQEKLLTNEAVGLLARLLLPLMGGEEYDEDEMEKFPLDCQYLPPEKKREPDWDFRRVLVDILLLFCSKSYGRSALRDRGVYYILRELHKWEETTEHQLHVEKVVDILIREEEDYEGVESIMSLNVPEHLTKTFHEEDKEFANI